LSRDYARFSVLEFFLAGKMIEERFGRKIFSSPNRRFLNTYIFYPVKLAFGELQLFG